MCMKLPLTSALFAIALLLLLVLAPTSTRGDESWEAKSLPVSDGVREPLEELFQKYYPEANFRNRGVNGLHFEHEVTTFEFPSTGSKGEKREAEKQRGPKEGGILCRVYSQRGLYRGQLAFVHDAWTTSKKSVNRCTPELASLAWKRTAITHADAAPGIRVRVLLSAQTHSREMLRKNIGFDQLSVMGDGIIGTVNGQTVNNLVAVMAHRCRLEPFEKTEYDGMKFWDATIFVTQDRTSDGSNLQLTQQRLDQIREQGVQFGLDHHRDQIRKGAPAEISLAASSIATKVASRIEELKDSYPHLAKFSAVEHLRKNTVRGGGLIPGTRGNPELYSIDYRNGVLAVKPAPRTGPRRSAEFTYDPETGIKLYVHFFKGDSRGADLRPPFRIGNVSVHVYVSGPAAGPIRDEIVRSLKELAADVKQESDEQQEDSPASPPAPVAPPTGGSPLPPAARAPTSISLDPLPPSVPDPLLRSSDAKSDSVRFSETHELVLSMNSMKYMLDLDTGRTMDPPATVGRPEQVQMDVHTDQVQPYHYPVELIGRGLQGVEVKANDWHASAAEVRRALAGDAVGPLKQMDLGPEKNPTYFFKTRDGAMGVLQLLEIVDEPKGIRLRYKRVELEPGIESAPRKASEFVPKKKGKRPPADDSSFPGRLPENAS